MQLCYRLSDTSWERARPQGHGAGTLDTLLQTDPQNFSYRYRNMRAHHVEGDILYAAGQKSEAGAFAERFASLFAR